MHDRPRDGPGTSMTLRLCDSLSTASQKTSRGCCQANTNPLAQKLYSQTTHGLDITASMVDIRAPSNQLLLALIPPAQRGLPIGFLWTELGEGIEGVVPRTSSGC